MVDWVPRNPGFLAVAKTKPSQLLENVHALDLRLSIEDLADLDREFPAPTEPAPLAKS